MERYPIIVPTTATQEVQDSSRMVVDLRLKTVVKDNYGVVGRAAQEAEIIAEARRARYQAGAQ